MIKNIVDMSRNKVEAIKLYMYLYVFLLPWNFFSGFFSNLTILLLLWWIFIANQKGYFLKLKDIFTNKPLIAFSLFILYATLSLLWSDNIKVGIKELEYYKYYPIIAMVFFSVFNKEDVKIAFYVMAFSFGVYAIFSLSIYMELFTVEMKNDISNKINPRGILPYAVVTFYMALNVFFSFYFFAKETNKKIKYIFLFISIISFFTILVNNGRMGQLSFLGTLFVLMIYYRQYFYQYKKLLISLFLALILSISFFYSSNKIDRYLIGIKELHTSYENNVYTGSWGARLFMWKAVIELIPENLLFGSGVGDALVELNAYKKENKEELKGWITHYHNHYFEYLSKFGISGYLIFLLSIFILLRTLYKVDKDFFYIGLVFFTMFFINSFGDSIIRMSNFDNFFILIFVLLSITIQEKLDYKIRNKN